MKYKNNNLESYKNNIMRHKEIEMKLYKDYQYKITNKNFLNQKEIDLQLVIKIIIEYNVIYKEYILRVYNKSNYPKEDMLWN